MPGSTSSICSAVHHHVVRRRRHRNGPAEMIGDVQAHVANRALRPWPRRSAPSPVCRDLLLPGPNDVRQDLLGHGVLGREADRSFESSKPSRRSWTLAIAAGLNGKTLRWFFAALNPSSGALVDERRYAVADALLSLRRDLGDDSAPRSSAARCDAGKPSRYSSIVGTEGSSRKPAADRGGTDLPRGRFSPRLPRPPPAWTSHPAGCPPHVSPRANGGQMDLRSFLNGRRRTCLRPVQNLGPGFDRPLGDVSTSST